jgi:hypothetical protein
MKKGLYVGVVASLLLGLGCSAPKTEYVAKPQSKVAPKITIIDERGHDDNTRASSDLTSTERSHSDDASCSENSDCIVIPVEGCVPCMDNAGQKAVNKAAARRIMAPLKNECMPVYQKLRDSQGKDFKASKDASCKLNGANCVEGTCQLANLTEEELKSRIPQGGQGQGEGPVSDEKGSFGGQEFDQGHGYQGGRQPGIGRGYESENRDWSSPQGYGNREYPAAGPHGFNGFPQDRSGLNFDQGRGLQGGSPWGGQAGFGTQPGWGGQGGFGTQPGFDGRSGRGQGWR